MKHTSKVSHLYFVI